MKEIIDRFKAKTPAFWRKVRNWAAGFTASFAVLMTNAHNFPPLFVEWAKILGAVSTSITILAQMTKEDELRS